MTGKQKFYLLLALIAGLTLSAIFGCAARPPVKVGERVAVTHEGVAPRHYFEYTPQYAQVIYQSCRRDVNSAQFCICALWHITDENTFADFKTLQLDREAMQAMVTEVVKKCVKETGVGTLEPKPDTYDDASCQMFPGLSPVERCQKRCAGDKRCNQRCIAQALPLPL